MTGPTDSPKTSGTAVIVFEPPMLKHLIETVRNLGFDIQAFDEVDEAMNYILHPMTAISVVVACGTMIGVLNDSDLVTRVSQAFSTLPIVVLDHYEGLVESNVMCLDKPWTHDEVEEQVMLMVARLPEGKRLPAESNG